MKIKYFFLGFACGAIITCCISFGIALIFVLKDGEKLFPGYVDGLLVTVTQQPREGYDWSLDISQQGEYLVSVGKRTGALSADRCKLFDTQGKLLVYMVWDDPEAPPGFLLYNDKKTIASLTYGRNDLEHFFSYGAYNFTPEEIHDNDTGYQDLDFDGRFDVKEVFNDDGTVKKTFIRTDEGWKEAEE